MKRKNIYLMYAIALLQGMVFYGAIATLYRQAHGVRVFQITLIESISLLLCIAFEIPWGILADQIGYKTTLVLCNGLYFLSKLVFWHANGFWQFLLERVLLSVAIAGISGVDTSLLYLSCRPGDSQRVFGIYDSMGLIGLVIASVGYSVWIREQYALAAALTAVTYGIAALLTLFLSELREKASRPVQLAEYAQLLRQLLRDPNRLLLLAAVACLTQTHQTVTVFLNQLQYTRCGLPSARFGYLYIAVALCGTCSVFSAVWSQKWGDRRGGTLLLSTAALACGALALTHSATLSVVSLILLRATNSLFQPFQLEWQNQMVRSANRATELSLCAMLVDGASAGISVLLGAIADFRLWAAFLCGGVLCLAGLGLFRLWYRRIASVCGKMQPSTGSVAQ